MTWGKIDDKLTMSEKWLAAGTNGQALWINALSKCVAQNSDGVVSALTSMYAAQCAGVAVDETAARLVKVGLWHDAKTIRKCERCRETVALLPLKRLPADGHYFHDWFDNQLSKDEAKDPVERWKFNRKKALHRNPALKQAIVERDGTICQYCEGRVDFKNHGPRGGTFDHVDPDGPNATWNLVVACNRCNTVVKGERTPEEAGMTLLNDPRLPRLIGHANPESDTDHSRNAPRIASPRSENAPTETENPLAGADAHARLGGGSGRTGNIPGMGSDPGMDGAGSDGPGPDGTGGAGPGHGPARLSAETSSDGPSSEVSA